MVYHYFTLQEDLPDIGEEEDMLVSPGKRRSYSPRREEKIRLLEEEVLPDTVSPLGKCKGEGLSSPGFFVCCSILQAMKVVLYRDKPHTTLHQPKKTLEHSEHHKLHLQTLKSSL